MMAVAFLGSLIMPNPKVHGYLDGAGTVEEALGKKRRFAPRLNPAGRPTTDEAAGPYAR